MDFNFVDVNCKQTEGDGGDDDDDCNDAMAVDPLSTDSMQPLIKGEYEELIIKCEPIDYDNNDDDDEEDGREDSQSNEGTSILPQDDESESSIQSSVGNCLETATKNYLEDETPSSADRAATKTFKTEPETSATCVLLDNRVCQVIPESSESNAYRIVPNPGGLQDRYLDELKNKQKLNTTRRLELVNPPIVSQDMVKVKFNSKSRLEVVKPPLVSQDSLSNGQVKSLTPSSVSPASTVLHPTSQLIKLKDNMYLVVRPLDSSQKSSTQTTPTPAAGTSQPPNRSILGLLVTNGPQAPPTFTPASAVNKAPPHQQSATVSNSNSLQNVCQPIDSNNFNLLSVNGSKLLLASPTNPVSVSNVHVGNQLSKIDLTNNNLPSSNSNAPTQQSVSSLGGNLAQTMNRSNQFSILSINGSNVLVCNSTPQSTNGNVLVGNQSPNLTKPLELAIPNSAINSPGVRQPKNSQQASPSHPVISFQPINNNMFTLPNKQINRPCGVVSTDSSGNKLSQPINSSNNFGLLRINGSHLLISPQSVGNQSQVGFSAVSGVGTSTTKNNLVSSKSLSSVPIKSPNETNSKVSPQSFLIALPNSQIQPSGSVPNQSNESTNLLKERLLSNPKPKDCTLVQPTVADSGYILSTEIPYPTEVNNSLPTPLKQAVLDETGSKSDDIPSLIEFVKDQQKLIMASTTLLDRTSDTDKVLAIDERRSPIPVDSGSKRLSDKSILESQNSFLSGTGGKSNLQESNFDKESAENGRTENLGTKMSFFIDTNGKLNLGSKLDTEQSSTDQNLLASNGKLNSLLDIEVPSKISPPQSFKKRLQVKSNFDETSNCTVCGFKLPNEQQLKIHKLVYHEVPYICDCGVKIIFYQSFAKHKCPHISLPDVRKAILNSKFTKLKSLVDFNMDESAMPVISSVESLKVEEGILESDLPVISDVRSVEGGGILESDGTTLESDMPIFSNVRRSVESVKVGEGELDTGGILESDMTMLESDMPVISNVESGVNMDDDKEEGEEDGDVIVLESDDSVDPLAMVDEDGMMLEPEVIVNDVSDGTYAIDNGVDRLIMAARGEMVGRGRGKRRRRTEENESTVSCPLCKQRVNDLEAHIREKHKFVCGVCDKEFNRKSNLLTHLAVHSDRRDYACKLCDKSYKSKAGLYIHERSHSIQKRPSCEYCSKSFLLSTHLRTHILSAHGNVARKFTCEICSKVFVVKRLYILHKNRHKEEGILCIDCGRRFVSEDELRKHSSVHTKQDLVHSFCCDLCGRTFRELHFLTAHRNSHARKRYKCKHCKMLFNNDFELQRHARSHEQYPCKVCDKVFAKEFALFQHNKLHEALTYKCKICLKFFTTESEMRTHLTEVHSVNNVFICDVCGATHRTRSRMITHKVTHLGEYIQRTSGSSLASNEQHNEPDSSDSDS